MTKKHCLYRILQFGDDLLRKLFNCVKKFILTFNIFEDKNAELGNYLWKRHFKNNIK